MRVNMAAGGQQSIPLQITGPELARNGDDWKAKSLRDRMAAFVCQHPLPAELVRKYVSYAQAFCNPTLSIEAKLMLKSFYLDLRQQAAASPCVPVTVPSTRLFHIILVLCLLSVGLCLAYKYVFLCSVV
jgi:hypothetical protein